MQRLLAQQRDRARREAEELGAENRRLKDLLRGQQVEGRKLQADNLKLFEKVKFLRASSERKAEGGSVAIDMEPGRNSLADEQTEARYRPLYEERLNPFAAFHKKER